MARFRKELRRKSIHLIGLLVPALYWVTGREVTLWFVAISLPLMMAFEFYRIRRGIPVREADALARPLIRPREKRGIGGHVYFAAGAFIAILAYRPKEIAITALPMATLADGGAAVIGSRWGRHKLVGKKTLEGSLTLFLIALALAGWLVDPLLAALAGQLLRHAWNYSR